MQATTSIFPEIELIIEGDIEPGEAETGPTYDCGGTPGHDAFVEGYSVVKLVIGDVDLLSGLSESRGIRELLSRIEAAVKDEAERALMLEIEA